MTTLLQSLIDETVTEIRSNVREDELYLPLQAERAAQQVIGRYNLASPRVITRLQQQTVAMEKKSGVIGDWQQFLRTSPRDFIAVAAKQQMGNDYSRLLHQRVEILAPTPAGDFG